MSKYGPHNAAEFIVNPHDWPAWPCLPMARRSGNSLDDLGFLLADEVNMGTALILHIGCIYLPVTDRTETFATVDDLLMEWRVD